MNLNNIKLLTDSEVEYLNDKFIFSLDDTKQFVLVGNKYYNRVTKHPVDQTFSLNTRVKRVSFNPQIISLWIKLNEEGVECTLFDVKQAVTKLYITYQELTDEAIKKSVKEEKK